MELRSLKTLRVNLTFKLLLFALYLLIRVTAWRSARLRGKLAEKDIAVVLRSKDDRIARTIRAVNGKVRSQKGRGEDVIANITWATPAAGTRVMLKMIKGDAKALMNAILAKDLLPEGDAAGIRWFLDVVTLLTKIYLKKPSGRPASPK